MRNRFEQQLEIGLKPISETPILQKSRDDVPALVAALVRIFETPEYNNRIFNILDEKILKNKRNTGRRGLNLWQIFVLAQFRLALNLDYDRLHYMVNSDSTLRQFLGIEKESGFEKVEIGYQRIIDNLPIIEIDDLERIFELEHFMRLMDKHIDLVERRLIKGEKIPHEEKLFSIFEDYTEWITKGKLRPNVELGKKTSITSDQYGLIIDVLIHENEAGPGVVINIADRISGKYKIGKWSFDKGYWHKDNKFLLEKVVEVLIMPKKGKPNKQEYEQEHTRVFKKFRNKHSAIESNINELEHRGLNRCPDKGYPAFKRYVALAVVAYNMHKIGKAIIKQELEKKQQARRQRYRKFAA